MLQPAKLHEDELRIKFMEIDFEERYKYYHASSHRQEYTASYETWKRMEYASIAKDGRLLGYIAYNFDRETNSVYRLLIINFEEEGNGIEFVADVYRAVHEIFFKFNQNKLSFSVVVGNPIERSYDRLMEEFNGSIVGIMREDVCLMDGGVYDLKMYEIFSEEVKNAIFFNEKLQRRLSRILGLEIPFNKKFLKSREIEIKHEQIMRTL